MATENTIEVNDAGPLPRAVIPILPGGGVVLLQGRNGAGKSIQLRAVKEIVHKSGGVPIRDNQSFATVSGLGVRVMFSRSSNRSGELDAVSLEGKFDLAKLVDPGLKDQKAADRTRIKTLIGLCGVTADLSIYKKLAVNEEEFLQIIRPSTQAVADPVELAAKVRADFHTAAKKAEDEAKNWLGQYEAHKAQTEGHDLKAETDPKILDKSVEQAIIAKTSLVERKDSHEHANIRHEEAVQKLAIIQEEYQGLSVESAQKAVMDDKTDLMTAIGTVDQISEQLRTAIVERDALQGHLQLAEQAEQEARRHIAQLAEFRQTLDHVMPEPVAPEEIEQAEETVNEARSLVKLGSQILDARNHKSSAEYSQERSQMFSATSERLRDAAKGTDGVLSALVNVPSLKLDGGRLVTITERGSTLFSELSPGERYKLVIALVCKVLSTMGVPEKKRLAFIDQEGWEGLDPNTQKYVHAEAREQGIVIIACEATNGDFRAVEYSQDASVKKQDQSVVESVAETMTANMRPAEQTSSDD